MFGDGDDAGHCSNGLSADNYRTANPEERATFRAWIRGAIVFYATILLLTGTIAILTYGDAGLTRLADLYAHATGRPDNNGRGAIRPPENAASAWW